MRTTYSAEFSSCCVVIEGGETADEIIERCYHDEATLPEQVDADTRETVYCVQFPSRGIPEVYTEQAIRRSLASKAAA